MTEIMLQFGALADPIEKQLNAQVYTLNKSANTFQEMADGIELAFVFSVITDGEWSKIGDRYMKQIKKYMKPLKEDEGND